MEIFSKIIGKVFGSKSAKDLKKLAPLASQIMKNINHYTHYQIKN